MAAALLKMSQLVDLQVTGVDYFGAAQLAALTRLTGLRHLVVEAKEGQQLLESFNGDCVSLHSRASPPDVWSQLRELCLQDTHGAAAINRPLQKEEQQESSSYNDDVDGVDDDGVNDDGVDDEDEDADEDHDDDDDEDEEESSLWEDSSE
uniref:Uncharacterized protein n=1 Tax=Tetradesmus obliquus TaxID=3088 RepID=A0A383WBW2_TETOB|eukprot:jgi/Sobl393_1/10664/SZX74700.1